LSSKNTVLIVGAGIGGMKAAFEIASAGYRVTLIDTSPFAGGKLSQIENQFPNNVCGVCQMFPVFNEDECHQYCFRRGFNHPNIDLVAPAKVEKVEGSAGDFRVTLRKISRLIREELCTACGKCVDVCPVEVPDRYEEGLTDRKAVYSRSISQTYTIDRDSCTRCGACVDVCPTRAVDLELEDEVVELEAGAVILSPGFEGFDPTGLTQYGLAKYVNVVTSLQLERMISGTSRMYGNVVRPSGDRAPRNVAFIQCVGSRDQERRYCSSTCCMISLKEAALLSSILPDVSSKVFYIDMRTFGKGHYRYQREVEKLPGVELTRCRVTQVTEEPSSQNLSVGYENEEGEHFREEYDMVVLATGCMPPRSSSDIRAAFGINVDEYGFCSCNGDSSVSTSREGVFACGSFIEPCDISQTITTAAAAAAGALGFLDRPGSLARTGSSGGHREMQKPAAGQEGSEDKRGRIGVLLCTCGEEIAGALDVEAVKESLEGTPSIVHVERVKYLCHENHLESAVEKIREAGVEKVVIAACSPYSYEAMFVKALSGIGISPEFIDTVNILDQVARVHEGMMRQATEKAESIIKMSADRLRLTEPFAVLERELNSDVLVVGGGLAGLTASLALAGWGFGVHLVEKADSLGGNTRKVHFSLDGSDPREYLKRKIEAVEASEAIHVHTGSYVVSTSGCVGDFTTVVREGESETEVRHGAVIVATGAHAYRPDSYLYGRDHRVMTQYELEEMLAVKPAMALSLDTVVMIQCVGSRDEEHTYCSRICCMKALNNSLKLKEKIPDARIYVLYRDMMAYGLLEEYYLKARESHVNFIRYDLDRKPEVRVEDGALAVEVYMPLFRETLVINPDALILSTGIVAEDNETLARTLGVDLDSDGFFSEANAKFRPVDTLRDGIFVCGLAHSPQAMTDTAAQAEAAAMRVVATLAPGKLISKKTVARVVGRWCTGCGMCIETCPYEARVMDEETHTAKVIEILCRGCGECMTVCPSGATKLTGYRENQIFSMLDVIV